MCEVDIEGSRKSVQVYSMSHVSNAEQSIQVASDTVEREKKRQTLHQCMRVHTDGLESTRTAAFCARSKSDMKLNFSPF